MPDDPSPFMRDLAARPREPGIRVLDAITIEDCGEGLLDVREACPLVFVDAPLPWLRVTACRLLDAASRDLPSGVRLLVTTCLRTLDMQAAGYEAYMAHLIETHPEWPAPVRVREANRFFHPPHAKAPPGHCTGGAVDLRLVTEDRQELDMWSQLIRSDRQTWRTFSSDVLPEVREARRMLYDAMVGAGFSNCWDEWWHYSYGDSGWAARLGKPVAVYGAVPEECFPDELAREVAILRREGRLTRVPYRK